MSETKQVKVDNWGIYFLQRLKHFFNRTDYCDLTLQFQDNAQLKVHRLVLNACTEYFEYLERMCEMYEDCLIMPDDLQADVVVPIVNFMYTGQLEYRADLLDKLYQTAQIMNMTVLTKLLDAQRGPVQEPPKQLNTHSYSRTKRSYTKAFDSSTQSAQKKVYIPNKKVALPQPETIVKSITSASYAKSEVAPVLVKKRSFTTKTGPTRYELPEELESDIFDDSFSNISYESKPLMIHPQAKHVSSKSDYRIYGESSGSKKIADFKRMILDPSTSTIDIVECKKINSRDDETIFDDENYLPEYNDVFGGSQTTEEPTKDTNELFDKILDNEGPKLTFETKELKDGNVDHAKIISEVLKKYPHLMKSNKNIKLKIVNTSNKPNAEQKTITRHRAMPSSPFNMNREIRVKNEDTNQGFTYETDVIDSKEAARLIAMGAENITGPWICLICGTPGKALHFTTYYKYRRHLVEVHKEKPIVAICEHCGLRSSKRNYMLHHMYTKHDITPPPAYKFPKCNQCPYIALTEAFLIKHKLTHSEAKTLHCNVCFSSFKTPTLLLQHMQNTGHKVSAEKKPNLQCIYCLKVFLRENNLYAHLKTYHKQEAKSDGIIENSDEDDEIKPVIKSIPIKYEPLAFTEDDSNETQYQIQQKSDNNIQIVMKTPRTMLNQKQKILNQDLDAIEKNLPKTKKVVRTLLPNSRIEFMQDEEVEDVTHSINTLDDDMVMIDESEFIVKNQITRSKDNENKQYMSEINIQKQDAVQVAPSTSTNFTASVNQEKHIIQQPKMILKKAANMNQPIQIVVSNEEEYKALMASNPSIIFDNTSATIDLSNSQANDMMIIQQDYPLNVSEAVQTDNSNIVVVYSHPVDEQNKQYLMNAHYAQPQLITSSIGAQYVQSSAVISQNFETITTSASMVTGPVLVEQPIETWQEDIQQNIVNQTVQISTDALQEIATVQHEVTPDMSINSSQTDVDSAMTELPAIQLEPQEQPAVITPINISEQPTMHQTEESAVLASPYEQQSIQEFNNLNMDPVNTQVILQPESEQTHDNINETEITSSSVAIGSEKPSEIEESTHELEEPSHEIEQQTHKIAEPTHEIAKSVHKIEVRQEIEQPNHETEEITHELEKTLTDSSQQNMTDMIVTEGNKSTSSMNVTETSEIDDSIVQNVLQESDAQELEQIQDEPVIENENLVETNDQIQNLASEWSEDEDNTLREQLTNDTQEPSDISNVDTTNIDTSSETDKVELEESVENIQQEMKKQLMGISGKHQNQTSTEPNPVGANGSAVPSQSLQDNVNIVSVTTVMANGQGAQEKISSLLNDWDENDSQEDEPNENEDIVQETDAVLGIEIGEQLKVTESAETDIVEMQKSEPLKNDDIKTLVSDWDDDGDDEKQN